MKKTLCTIGNRHWTMENRHWTMKNRHWIMENLYWSMENQYWKIYVLQMKKKTHLTMEIDNV